MGKLKHKVKVNVAGRDGATQEVLTGTSMSLPKRLLRFFFGEMSDVMVITPGNTVEGIEIKEVGGEKNETV